MVQPVKRGAWRRLDHVSRFVTRIVLVVGLVALGFSWSVASPIASSPDDDFHLGSIWCGTFAPDTGCVRVDPRPDSSGVLAVRVPALVSAEMTCFKFKMTDSAVCQSSRPTDTGLASSRANDSLYPAGYYTAMSLLVGSDATRSALTMRFAAFLISAGLLLVSLALIAPRSRSVCALALLVGLVPLGVYLMASNNPSGTAVAGVSSYWIALMATLEQHIRGRRRVFAISCAIVSVIVATMSRADAGVYIIAATAAALVLTGSGWASVRRWAWIAVPCAIALWVVASSGQSAGSVDGYGLPSGEARALGDVLYNNVVNLPWLWAGALGASPLGWLDTPLPAIVPFTMAAAFIAVTFAGLRYVTTQKVAALGILVGVLILVPSYVLAMDRRLVGDFVQPRYLLPLFPVIGATAMWRRSSQKAFLGRFQIGLVLVGALVAHAVALHANIRRYVTGNDVLGFDLGARREWWWDFPLGPMAVWVLGTLGFAVAVVAALVLLLPREDTPLTTADA